MGKGLETGQFNFDAEELAYINSNWVHLDHDQQLTVSGGVSYLQAGTTWTASALFGSGLRRGLANTGHLPAYWPLEGGAPPDFAPPMGCQLKTRGSGLNPFVRSFALRDGTGKN